jgi:hypothetical protein
MKKPKRSAPFDEQPEMEDLDIEFESQDDEIIDLEDIIEMPARSIDEDEDLDLDVEILDAYGDLDQEPQEMPAPRGGKAHADTSRVQEEDDLIKSLGEETDEEEEGLFEPAAPRKQTRVPVLAKETPLFDEEDEDLLAELMDEIPEEPLISEPVEEPEQVDLRERAASAMRVAEESRPPEPEPPVSEEVFDSPPAQPEPVRTPAQEAAVDRLVAKTTEELLGRMETSLLENLRMMVEMMLPDLVREIITEEIAKLKKESE